MGNRYLIDTHILLWWLFDDFKLDRTSKQIIQNSNNQIFVSSASAWEIATKYRIGKLPSAQELVQNYTQVLQEANFLELAITNAHAIRAGSLPIAHRDPFDRMIMAQGELEKIPIITHDLAFDIEFIEVVFPK